MNVKAPKAPPMMGPIGRFESDFPCTKTVTTPGAADVGLNEEDVRVENTDEKPEGSCVENDEKDTVANAVGGVDVVDGVLVVEIGGTVVKVDDEVIEIQVVQKK